ncbi:MAG: hypothetical protein IPN17_35095 [Deltaproteobacteria bacterium]|nr:hypothetical protein [Deltaproteobacteria bacterium]
MPELARRKAADREKLVVTDGVEVPEEGDRHPWVADARALSNVIRAFVLEYIGLYAPTDEALEGDVALIAFWSHLQSAPPTVKFPGRSKAAIVDLLAQFIWSVTGLHEAVGTVNEYVIDPTFMGTKIRPGREMSDVQASMQYLLVMALTGLGMPRLMDVGDAAGSSTPTTSGAGRFSASTTRW